MRYDSTINEHVERFISEGTLETYKSKFGQEFIDWYDPTDDETNAKLTYLDDLGYTYDTFDDFLYEIDKLDGNNSFTEYESVLDYIHEYLDECGVLGNPNLCISYDYDYEKMIRDYILNGLTIIIFTGEILSADWDDIKNNLYRPITVVY